MAERPLEGKVAIVTGAGSPIGFGRAMTLAMVRAGARVAMMDVNREQLDQSAADAQRMGSHGCVLPIVGDVTNPEDAARAVQQTIDRLGGLHILVNNAGTNQRNVGLGTGRESKFWEITPEAWNRVFAVNAAGPFLMARAAVGHLVAQGWGRIIGVTTSLGTMYRGARTPYGPSKAAHEAFMGSIAQDLEGTGVTVNVLIPGGPANTNLLGPEADRSALIQPEVMERPVVWLASEAASGMHGLRFIAYYWYERLPLDERLKKASAPLAWQQLGTQVIFLK